MNDTKKIPTSQDPEKYYRTGIAIPIHRKVIFEERLAALGLKTVGDLTTMFIVANGVVEALLPIAQEHVKNLKREFSKAGAINELKKMSPKELERLLELAKSLEESK